MSLRKNTRGQMGGDPWPVGVVIVAVITTLVYSEMAKEVAGLPRGVVVYVVVGVGSVAVSLAVWYLIALALQRIHAAVVESK